MDTRSRFTVQKVGGEVCAGGSDSPLGEVTSSLTYGIRRGVVFGPEIERGVAMVAVIVAPVSPFVARWTEQVTCTAFGVILFLVGFALRSLRYRATLLNLDIR